MATPVSGVAIIEAITKSLSGLDITMTPRKPTYKDSWKPNFMWPRGLPSDVAYLDDTVISLPIEAEAFCDG
jgi:hypothetical protein